MSGWPMLDPTFCVPVPRMINSITSAAVSFHAPHALRKRQVNAISRFRRLAG